MNPEKIKLQPPGAGLPWVQALMLRYVLGPFVSKRMDPAEVRQKFEAIHNKIISVVESVPPERRDECVLVSPIAGLEDSSRYWSLNMVLEHMLIVGEAAKRVSLTLARGEQMNMKVDIAAVKPKGQGDGKEVLQKFKAFTQTAMNELEPVIRQSKSNTTLTHPWFGPFNARQWYWLLAAHASIHYQQAKKIKEGLSLPS